MLLCKNQNFMRRSMSVVGGKADIVHTTTWATFIRAHLAVLAGTDFFTAEVLTLRGLVTYYVLFFIHLESRKGGHCRDHRSPERAMDAANGPERDHGGMRHPSG